ncbi:MAG: type VI secretion system tip protein VgrG [Rhizobiaceae bacterium]|jgi:type VI secretion system secreted protein VgrG|nr:type VI secretion system tip protein VgrG [Rhizobiaceae bacterium]
MNLMPRQAKRAAVLETPLGADVLALARIDGSEGVNELFEYRVEALSMQGDIDFDALLGLHATVTMNGVNGGKRKFDGIVTEAHWIGVRDHFHAYRLILRPWLWVLSQQTDCFIFHNKKAPAIIAEVFGRHGALADFEDRTSGSYPVMEYCVQYRESDMAFVCRLMEEHGINFHFAHSDGAHRLVMTDASAQHDAVPGGSRRYIPLAGEDRRTNECFHLMVPERRFVSGKTAWRDYNFKTPSAKMQAEQAGASAYANGDKELYDFPGRYEAQGQGKEFARIRLESEEAQDRRCMAAGNCVTLNAGGLVTVKDHPFDRYNKEHLVVQCQFTLISQSYRSGSAGEEDSYEGQYELLESSIPLRPLKLTPRPLMHGPQTAVVVGKEGEEIDCDEYGRILVRFHWDRRNDQSMRCRVSQSWASKRWGGMVIPRIGMEVVVEHLEGDPDRPLVTGCVYNAANMPPYTLPQFKTRSTLMSDTHKGTGFNELRFEDEKSEEEVFLHAQKFLNAIVLDNETWHVGGNRAFNVAKSASQSIGGDKDMTVGGSHREVVGANRDETIGRNQTRKIGANEHLAVGADQIVTVGGDHHMTLDGNARVEAGGNAHQKTGGTHFIDVGREIVIDAGMSICLKVGGNFISISPAGIQIEGTLVRVNCGGAPSRGAPVTKKNPARPAGYKGPHAKRYPRSSQK